jgi:cell division protein FtsB
MREFQAKKRFRKILYSRSSVAVLLIILAFLAHATWNVFTKERESAANVIEASREHDKLQSRQQVLTVEIQRLSTDQGVEEEIRNKYSVSKPGEHLLIIVDNASSTASTSQTHESWWDRFKKLFK